MSHSLATAQAAAVERLSLEFLKAHDVTGEFLVTEQGFSIDFEHANRGRLAFVAEDRAWIAWNGTHWDSACAETLAESFFDELIRAILQDAIEAGPGKHRECQLERVKLASSARVRRNALALAQPKLMISRDAFDRNAEDFLNTPSGIVNLRTGELSACAPSRYLTQCTAIKYDPEAPEPKRFLELVYYLAGEDKETYDWLLRALGYTITGRVHEDLAFFLRGPGGNGKSTLLKAVAAVLGAYAHPLDIKFLTAGGDAGHSTDFAAVRGKRLVVTSEVNKGQRLSTSRMKDLTGGDLAAFRDIRESAKHAPKFVPSLKLWLYGNYDLAVPGTDEGTWRRIVKISSEHRFPQSSVRESIVAGEGEGILRVLVEAAGRWYRDGLAKRPARIAEATDAYRRSQDLLGKFFADCLVFEEAAFISKKALNDAYQQWLEEEGGDMRVGPRELSQRLAERGVSECRTKTARGWKGVRAAKPGDAPTPDVGGPTTISGFSRFKSVRERDRG